MNILKGLVISIIYNILYATLKRERRRDEEPCNWYRDELGMWP